MWTVPLHEVNPLTQVVRSDPRAASESDFLPSSKSKKEFGLLYIQPGRHNDPPPNLDESTKMLSTNCIGLLTKLNANRSSLY